MVLVSRRHVRSNNSWLHHVPNLGAGRDRCTLLIHPDDAGPRGIEDGKPTRITSAVGSIVAPAELSDEMKPGVCNNFIAPGDFLDVP